MWFIIDVTIKKYVKECRNIARGYFKIEQLKINKELLTKIRSVKLYLITHPHNEEQILKKYKL